MTADYACGERQLNGANMARRAIEISGDIVPALLQRYQPGPDIVSVKRPEMSRAFQAEQGHWQVLNAVAVEVCLYQAWQVCFF